MLKLANLGNIGKVGSNWLTLRYVNLIKDYTEYKDRKKVEENNQTWLTFLIYLNTTTFLNTKNYEQDFSSHICQSE